MLEIYVGWAMPTLNLSFKCREFLKNQIPIAFVYYLLK